MKIKRILFLLLLGAAGALALRFFVIEGIYIASGSMEPTLPVNTNVFVNKLAYLFSEPKRGDIVCLHSPDGAEKDLVKRIIGVPGDVIELRVEGAEKTVHVNGSRISENYVKHTRKDEKLAGDDLGPMTVPQKNYFVMGDNRDESKDSRDWVDASGKHLYFVPEPMIVGRLYGVY